MPDTCYYKSTDCGGALWYCRTCEEWFCENHGHVTDKGTNVECVSCERERHEVEKCCDVCGDPFVVNTHGIANHMNDGEIDHDADADHVPYMVDKTKKIFFDFHMDSFVAVEAPEGTDPETLHEEAKELFRERVARNEFELTFAETFDPED